MNAPTVRERLDGALDRAVEFLYRNQLSDGEFKTYAGKDAALSTGCFDSSPYATALILHSLGFAPVDRRLRRMVALALDFLEAEREEGGLWRYWSSKHENHDLVPPDLDDICCASTVLRDAGRGTFPNIEIVRANRDKRGLFYTWLIPRDEMSAENRARIQPETTISALLYLELSGVLDDIDCIVNSNVLHYLGDDASTRNASAYLTAVMSEGAEHRCSRYYPNPLALYYMLSRAFAHGARSLAPALPTIVTRLIDRQQDSGSFGTELDTALAICALQNCSAGEAAREKAALSVLSTQQSDGSWRRISLFLGPAPHYGSEELTTAFCAEALARHRAAL